MMKHSFAFFGVAGSFAMLMAASSRIPIRAAVPSFGPDSEAIDPSAMTALDKMGEYLRNQKTFSVHALVTSEDVMEDGRKAQTLSVIDLVAERPDAFRVDIANDRRPRTLFYDGRTFTMWAPALKFYAKVDAPKTIGELANTLEDKYDIDVPLVDLFRCRRTSDSNAKEITAATDLGPSAIDGVTCEQFSFRQDGADWEVWIQEGDFPLPRRLVITTTTDDARPQYSATYTWNLAPSISSNAFAFTPPADAKRITIAEVAAMRDSAKAKGRGDRCVRQFYDYRSHYSASWCSPNRRSRSAGAEADAEAEAVDTGVVVGCREPPPGRVCRDRPAGFRDLVVRSMAGERGRLVHRVRSRATATTSTAATSTPATSAGTTSTGRSTAAISTSGATGTIAITGAAIGRARLLPVS